jgi:HlyD family secretion protein
LFEQFEQLDLHDDENPCRSVVCADENSMSTQKLAGLSAAFIAALVLTGCDKNNDRVLQGWVEAELIFISPDQQGRVETLSVREGDVVTTHAPLFTVDDDLQQADLAVKKAAVIKAQQAFDRAQELLKAAVGTQKTYEDAEAVLRQTNANLAASETHLTRRVVFSPGDGTIEQVYYRPGETVPADRPVVALLPPHNLKLRFFAPQALLPEIKYDETVGIACDGCEMGLTAKVSFISRSAEFTPPVIYSREERAKLVFLIEARPEQPEKFRVGQPVTVTLPKQAPQ